MKNRFVLDAWAVLALLKGEQPAAWRVAQVLGQAGTGEAEAYLSIINLGEVFYRIGRLKGEEEAAATLEGIRLLAVTTVPASEDLVFAAATLKMHHAISYADAFALASAERLSATVLTGDPELVQLGDQFQIERLARK